MLQYMWLLSKLEEKKRDKLPVVEGVKHGEGKAKEKQRMI